MIKILITDTETDKVMLNTEAEAVIGGMINNEQDTDENSVNIDGATFVYGEARCSSLISIAEKAIADCKAGSGVHDTELKELLGELINILSEKDKEETNGES